MIPKAHVRKTRRGGGILIISPLRRWRQEGFLLRQRGLVGVFKANEVDGS